ncbi:MAG: ATP-binding cassette domain-containing protein [Clostridia bacterium]|nr:ATP-binding cassette domain-containing protein [Clostridia bacterium]
MIEVKNLCKTYTIKKSNEVTKALDDVSICFPETGMVFLLGKSGSGKSTLLNVCGGLDKPDSGEIIIMGRSSKDFTASNFDSYRNTYVGFVFQEYNILNEFSVSENIALALELQGKKNNKEAVANLLKEVDLVGFESRKPNTLSGGQKQRIAIARALIKDPKIIMADEPTGALDSKTGKQVLDTLKKLSEKRLVIVVSHDREFAEYYGDRIIELKDGKIIRDETKNKLEANDLTDGIKLIGTNTLSIKDVQSLDNDAKQKVIDFISSAEGNLIVSNETNMIESFKTANRIDDNDRTEIFEDSATTKNPLFVKKYENDETNFIKSHMPFTKAFRMALSSLKIKKFRLALTIILSTIAFILFGVASSLMTYNEYDVQRRSLEESDYSGLIVNQVYSSNISIPFLDFSENTYFTDTEIKDMYAKFGNNTLAAFMTTSSSYSSIYVQNVMPTHETLTCYTYTSSINGLAISGDNSQYRTSKLISGSYPTKANEIAISKWYATCLINNSIQNVYTNQLVSPKTMNDLIGITLKVYFDKLNIPFLPLKIVGVFEGSSIPYNYADSKAMESMSSEELSNYKQFVSDTDNLFFLVSDNFYTYLSTHSILDTSNPYDILGNEFDQYLSLINTSDFYIDKFTVENESDIYSVKYFNNNKNSLSKGELAVTLLSILTHINMNEASYLNNWFNNNKQQFEALYTTLESKLDSLIDFSCEYTVEYPNYLQLKEQLTNPDLTANELAEIQLSINTIKNFWKTSCHTSYAFTKNVTDILNNLLNEDPNTNAFQLLELFLNTNEYKKYFENEEKNSVDLLITNLVNAICQKYTQEELVITLLDDNGLNINYSIAGIVLFDDYVNNFTFFQTGYTVVNKNNLKELNGGYNYYNYLNNPNGSYELSDTYYSSIYVQIANNNTKKLFDMITNGSTKTLKVNNSLIDKVSMITSLVNVLKKVFLYTGIAIALFSALLLFNFINVSIHSKEREIGVLRAVGARGTDVFKIFFSESLFITTICLVISIIVSAIIVLSINKTIVNELGFTIKILNYGIVSIAMMVGISAAVSFIGTFFPVLRLSRKKPVDTMRSVT